MRSRLLSHGAVYFAASVAARGLSFLLTPLYTRVLGADDYGVLGLANTVTALVALLLGLGLHAAMQRIYFDDERVVGTVTWTLVVVPGLVLLVLLAVGWNPFVALPNEALRLVLIAGWLSVFHALPQSVFQARQEPGRVALYNLALVVVQLGLILWWVDHGLIGVLRAVVVSNAALALAGLLILRPRGFDRALLRRAFLFGLPLLPHLAANWLLSLSDRLLLERAVSKAALGAYTLAYLFNALCSLFCSAVTQALTPLVTRALQRDPAAPEVPRLGLTAWSAMCVFCLLTAMFAPQALHLLAPRGPLDEALVYVPFVVLGALFQGGYYIVSQGTWFGMRTAWVGPVTMLAAAVNVTLNVLTIPRFGVLAAAVNTAVGYALLLLLHARLAAAVFPIRWPYWKGVGIAAAALSIYVLWLQ